MASSNAPTKDMPKGSTLKKSPLKDQIKGAILPSKQQEIFQKIKEDLKKTAKITIKEDVLNASGKQDEDKAEDKKPAEPAKPAAAEKK